MAFAKVDQSIPNFPELEQRVLELWKARRVFARSLELSEGKPEFVFYEGPPTANGLPHNGHVLTRVIKDLFPRYMTMRGYHVERRAGWDTHGLPVEVEVEKQLRISGKEAIVEYGVDRFARRCMKSVFKYIGEWEHLTERIGFWVDLRTAYVTYHKSYVESVWWALSELFRKGLLYKGHKSVWWWAQGGTALSAGEVGNSYRTVDDPSVYVRFPLVDEDAALVVWTTTPWTLPSNMFAAVHPDFEYAYARRPSTGHTLILAKELVPSFAERIGEDLEVQRVVKGADLLGKRYRPPFDAFARDHAEDERYWRVVPGDRSSTTVPQYFVTLDAGTGIVHIAPAFGEDDWKLWRRRQQDDGEMAMFCAVRPDGKLDHRLAGLELEGVWVKDADKKLTRDLKERELLVHAETYRHEYPFCWRSENDPLIQYVRDAWFVRTTAMLDRILENNQQVAWQPEHIRDGRMGDFLEGNVDWALSRERFWGTPLNIWVCAGCGHMVAPASCAEIERMNPHAFDAFRQAQAEDPELAEHLIVHKPWIDQVELPCPECQGTMRREPEVIDVWFDAGCMPFAQLGYPHAEGSVEAFERTFPADFISEAIDQTRGWFYSLMAINNLVFDKAPQPVPFKRCIVLGHVLDKAGKKESKSSGNYTPPEVIMDAVRMQFGVVPTTAAYAGGTVTAGAAHIAPEDLDGLDLPAGAEVVAYRQDRPEQRLRLKLSAKKKLPRRVVLLSVADQEALGLEYAPEDVMPVEVPSLPPEQRVVLEYDGVPAPGADAFRWFFYASNPPWNSTRHSLGNVRKLQKELPIKVRNVYSFFVTYANIDGFDPVGDESKKRPVAERPLLDRWVLGELEQTKHRVTEHMDAFRSYEATQVLSEFVEGLSNWYVRRSRDRFWAEGREQDKLDAYWTLFQCLRDLTILLAPFLPFSAEDMYQNLVVGPYGEGLPDSVHLRLYPSGDQRLIDDALSRDMAEVRGLVSLGLQVRAAEKLKIRQMLSEAKIVLAKPERREALERYVEVMKDELNVRSVSFLERADAFVTHAIKPNFKALGRRLGPKMKAVQRALSEGSAEAWVRTLESEGVIVIHIDDQEVRLGPDDVTISVEAKPGFAAASAPVGVVVLDTTLTDALLDEGRFREVLARVQNRRKELNLDFTDRIRLALGGSETLLAACRPRRQALASETLATEVKLGEVPSDAVEVQVGDETLRVHVEKV